MEVMGVSRSDDSALRERIVASILKTGFNGSGVGIWGAEVCQRCGELGTYWALAGAMVSHAGGEFACRGCRNNQGRHVARDQAHCYCECCQKRVERKDALSVARRWLCDRCGAELSSQFDEEQLNTHLSRLARRRYLELKPSLDDLRRHGLTQAEQRLALDEIHAEGEERRDLESRWEERWLEALAELSEIHGVRYRLDDNGTTVHKD